MNSLGSSSKWPSYDSLPSTSSFVLSESDQTEDETDFFSEGEGDSGRRKSLSVDEGITFSENYLDFPAHSDQLNLRSKSDQAKSNMIIISFQSSLTSFQQSVAIDRLQRILGILQKPEMGEKYLQNLLQIEMMLKMWFPQVAFQSIDTPKQTITPQLRPHWCQSQLHMPVKKRKLSWSNPHHAGNVPTKHKHRQQEKHGSCHDSTSFESVSTRLSGSPKKMRTPEEETVGPAGCSCKTGREFTDSTGTLSSPTYLCSKRQKQAEISPPSPHGSPATQDSSVSSSETVTTNDSPYMPARVKAEGRLDYISIKLGAEPVCDGFKPL
uniref:Circadian associated repressor of transcription a n=1 Tax=Seriola dumerili TaxID=41447 RepID=A0A3B4V6I7_SERDU